MKKHSNSVKKSESPMKRRNPRAEQRRDSSEVMAELVSQLRQQLEAKRRASFGRGGRKLESSFKAWRFLVWLSKWERIRRGYGK